MADQTTPSSDPYELSEQEIAKLASLAVEAKQKAYCPYSNFPVGASLLLANGEYHTGSNVEIVSTPVGTCAERCAIAPVIASYARPQDYKSNRPEDVNIPLIRGMAVSTNVDPPSSPCGMCRQFIKEFCDGRMKIYMYGGRWDAGERDGEGSDGSKGRVVEVRTIGELLPMSFEKISKSLRARGS
jgi:cytidine deaminase